MPGEDGRARKYVVRPRRCARQVKNMCARDWLRSAGRRGNSYHQEGHGQGFLRGVSGGKPVCGGQAIEEDAVKISIRDVGDAQVVEVAGDVDLGTSTVLRRTLFEALPCVAQLSLNL